MNERLRQRYLKLMGFTPWVAVTALPGAAPSPLRDAGVVDDELDEVTNVTASPDLSALLADTSAGQVAVPAMEKKADNQPAVTTSVDRTVVESTQSLTFTLQAHRGSDVHLWVEQQQADAPGLTREEQQQLAALLKLFDGSVQSDPKRLVCGATAGKPMTAEIARPMFDLFLRRLLGRNTSAKLLLCASEATVQALFGSERYQPVMREQITILPVSTLTEMLADPAGHKRTSWQAMVTHGFA
ncbi:MAG: hypothetical protein KAG82_00595 [Alcanivoracaceae bacterium]|nr:hypothetical protein [Alcanivoracaceae bacterium]